MPSNLLDTQLADILESALDGSDEDVLVVDPTTETIERLVEVGTERESDGPSVQVLANEGTLKDVMADFIVASNAADLIADGTLALRNAETGAQNSLVITGDAVIALVTAGDRVGGLSTDDADFVEAARESYATAWDDAEQFKLRTPPLSRVRETLESEIGPSAEEDFEEVLASLETARGNGEGLDEVTISLLVAAKNEALLYDISKWGEDVGIASKATFSRTKTKLEDMGLLDTEKVPIDVGRPRLRLKLGDDRLLEADANQVAGVAQSLLN